MRDWKIRCLFGLAILALSLGAAAGIVVASDEAAASPTLAAIDAALSRGEISEGQAILYKLYFVKGSDRLPMTFALGGDRIKCGTAIVEEARQKLDTLPTGLRGEIETFLVRPTLNSYIDTAHFRVHYSTSGTNMIYLWPNTAYRDSVMASCEKSYNFDVNHGWQAPPSDGGNGGGTNLIDCYVDNLSGVYGVTYSETPVPGGFPSDYTAYFVIDNDYTGFGYTDRTLPMKVTVAHEYHHVVQMGYTIGNNWWMENMATFMEDEIYDEINDNYQYLSCYMSQPYKKASTFNGCFEYACFIWPTFLKENWAHSVVRDVQYCAATTNVFTCFDNVLGGQSPASSYSAALAEWQTWNFYTWMRDDGGHYIEGANYHSLMAPDQTFATYPQLNKHPNSTKMPEATGASAMKFTRNTQSTDNRLTITFDGPACTEQVVLIAKEASGVVFHEYYIALDGNGNGTVDINGWDTMEYAWMTVSMARECGNGTFDYVFSAETSSGPTGVDEPPLYTRTIDLGQNAPNPFGPETRIGYRLAQSAPVHLAVFDAGGRQVRMLVQTTQAAGQYSIRWDGRDDAGHAVAPGVYFYRLNAAGASEMRKMVIAH